MYLCVCILRASLRCSKWLIEPEREQYFVLSHPLAPLWAQVCSQPWFLLPGNSQCCKRPCRGRGAGWGYRGGLFQLTAWVGASSYLWGALSMHAAKVHVPRMDRSAQIPGFYRRRDPQQMQSGRNLCKSGFLSSPFLCASLVCGDGTCSDLKALSLPRLSRRSAGSTATCRGPSATAFECRSAGAQPEPGENEALI